MVPVSLGISGVRFLENLYPQIPKLPFYVGWNWWNLPCYLRFSIIFWSKPRIPSLWIMRSACFRSKCCSLRYEVQFHPKSWWKLTMLFLLCNLCAQWVGEIDSRDWFHQHFTSSFYACRSQKCKKDVQSNSSRFFALLGSAWVKAVHKWWNLPQEMICIILASQQSLSLSSTFAKKI